MAKLNLTQINQVSESAGEDSNDFGPIPDGNYKMHAVKIYWKDTKAGTGKYLVFEIVLLEEYKGRYVFTNMNLDNPNPKAVQIAFSEFNQLCEAVGKVGCDETDELLQIPFMGTVTTEENEGYKPRNVIKKYSKIEAEKMPWEA